MTALALWPLMYWRGACGPRAKPAHRLMAFAVWTLTNPPAWFSLLGPLYLGVQIAYRIVAYWVQSQRIADPALGIFLPTRYLVPLELLASLGLAGALYLIYRGARYHEPAPPPRALPRFLWNLLRTQLQSEDRAR
ncbi:MAG TPA: hypothetical protein VIL08_02140 [Limnochorda sp.]